MPKGLSEAVNRRRTDSTMAKRTKGQTTIYKISYRNINRSGNTNPSKNRGWTQVHRKNWEFVFHMWHPVPMRGGFSRCIGPVPGEPRRALEPLKGSIALAIDILFWFCHFGGYFQLKSSILRKQSCSALHNFSRRPWWHPSCMCQYDLQIYLLSPLYICIYV
jgi:hypothetical protein